MGNINIIDNQVVSEIVDLIDSAEKVKEWEFLNKKQKMQIVKDMYLQMERINE